MYVHNVHMCIMCICAYEVRGYEDTRIHGGNNRSNRIINICEPAKLCHMSVSQPRLVRTMLNVASSCLLSMVHGMFAQETLQYF